MRWRVVLGFALTATTITAAACTPRPVDVGPSPDILWWTDNETGDVSDWTKDTKGSVWNAGGHIGFSTDYARSGRHSLSSTVMSSPGALSQAVVQRTTDMPAMAAYYSAWYNIPFPATPTDYWLFFKFRAACTGSDPSTQADAGSTGGDAGVVTEMWDLDFIPDGAGGLQFQLFGHTKNAREAPKARPNVKVGMGWFQVEAFLSPMNDGTGELTIWTDEIEIFDVVGLAAWPAQPCVEWSLGGITTTITPPTATLYIDDAAISTRRLGPTFPPFWRGN